MLLKLWSIPPLKATRTGNTAQQPRHHDPPTSVAYEGRLTFKIGCRAATVLEWDIHVSSGRKVCWVWLYLYEVNGVEDDVGPSASSGISGSRGWWRGGSSSRGGYGERAGAWG